MRVKTVTRPAGPSRKAESDDLARIAGLDARRAAKRSGGGAMTRRWNAILADLPGLAIAVSGGVDSMTLAHVAHRARRARLCWSCMRCLPPCRQQATARVRDHADPVRLARSRRWTRASSTIPRYRANPVNRCYFCKTNLYDRIAHVTEGPIASGANLDDLGDYRPGLIAAAEHRVRHPFVEAGMDKAAVRALARGFGLADISELPAQPCLSSRVETGIAIGADDLAFVARMERALAPHVPQGTDLRCRVTHGGIVVEAPEPDEAMRHDRGRAVRRRTAAASSASAPIAAAPPSCTDAA